MAKNKATRAAATQRGLETKRKNRSELEARAAKAKPTARGPFAGLVGLDVVVPRETTGYYRQPGPQSIKVYVLDAGPTHVVLAPSGRKVDRPYVGNIVPPDKQAKRFTARFRDDRNNTFTIEGDEVPAIWKDWKVMVKHVYAEKQ